MSIKKKPRGGRPSKFPPEFRRDAVAMVIHESRPIADMARAIGVIAGTLGNWVDQERIESGEREGLTLDERSALAELRTENAAVALLQAGERGPSAIIIRTDFPGTRLMAGIGHDGQQYYAIARQPMHLDRVARYLDRPRYRAGRPLLPWLAWLLHPQGGGPGLVVALAAIGAASLALGGVAAGVLAADLGASARVVSRVATLFSGAPGAIASLAITSPDALATALALTALALARRGRSRLALMPAVLAVLAKEALLVVFVGYAFTHLKRRSAIALAAVPALAVAGWWWWVRTALPGDPPMPLQTLQCAPVPHMTTILLSCL